ncbi:F-box protein At4g09920-like isoform X2 [Rutidosis leptorrhynchoides]|uniref:F-box protein At4g09920-like isoform X2 n=1 Tax=Rutidosis leptorrhynchoides TaxID=125765 RepID=UPI003A9A201C
MMEPAPGEYNASELASEDIISTMPENVITHILDRLPIQYAVRTAILSRNWRFKWTLLSHVVFDKKFSEHLARLGGENWYDERNMNRILLHLKGSITKFDLYIPNDKKLDAKDINHWVMFLSRKGIEEFNLKNMNLEPLKLSSHLFSCVKLECLMLRNCSLYPAPTFRGFPNLLSLDLYQVAFENGSLIIRLVGHFSKLQELYLDLRMCRFLGESGAAKSVCTSFRCLSTLILYPIDFGSDIKLLFAFEMIWSSPELQTLKITATYNDAVLPLAICSSALNHISMGQLKLRFVVFKSFRGSENEIYLIKNLLACSPFLKKIDIYVNQSMMYGGENGKLMFATKLLEFHRASTAAEVKIYWS